MAQKIFELNNKGMLRDLSISKSSNEYAYENRNIRLTPLDHNTLLSISNEKGPDKVDNIVLTGTALGHCVLNNYLIVFTTGDKDRIYKLTLLQNNTWEQELLYEGNLNFSTDNPIETLGLYESEAIQKVYWVDGRNQPRMINILRDYKDDSGAFLEDPKFDFVTVFNSGLEVSIDKQFTGTGVFPSGVIQYYVTYYNRYGQETNIVYSSPQLYLSKEQSGSSPEESVNCSFSLKFSHVDTDFDYMRVYSVIRTSYNGTPQLNIVGDIDLSNFSDGVDASVSIIDNGVYSESLNPTILLYIGGIEIIASTLTQKDNTLFLGDIENLTEIYDEDLAVLIGNFRASPDRNDYIKFVMSQTGSGFDIPVENNTGYYPYLSQLNYPSDRIKTFKGGETYRIGIRFFTDSGSYSSIYWLGDIFNPYYPAEYSGGYHRAVLEVILPNNIITYLQSNGYSQYQLYMAEATQSDRCVVAQGVLCPTVFNMRQRANNAPFSQSSWFFRYINGQKASSHYEQLPPMVTNVVVPGEAGGNIEFDVLGDSTAVEIQGICNSAPVTIDYDEESIAIDENKTSYEMYINCSIYGVLFKGNGGHINATIQWFDKEGNPTVLETWATDYWTEAAAALYPVEEILREIQEKGIPKSVLPSEDSLISFFQTACNTHGNAGKNNPSYFYYSNSGGLTSDFNDRKIFKGTTANTPDLMKNNYINKYGNNFYVDTSILTFHSPDINVDSIDNYSGYHVRIIGYAPITSNISNFNIQASTPYNGIRTTYNKIFSTPANTPGSLYNGLCAFPLWQDATVDKTDTLYWMYPWHKTGSISKVEIMDETDPANPVGTGEYYSVLESKTWANMFFSGKTVFKNKINNPTSGDDIGWKNMNDTGGVPQDNIRLIRGETDAAYVYTQNGQTYTYYGNIDTILPFNSDGVYPILNTGVENAASSEDAVLTSMYAQVTSYDAVNIAYRSTPHALVSFNDVYRDGELYRSCLPSFGTTDISHTLEGDLPWGEYLNEDYKYYNLMTYLQNTPQFQLKEASGNIYTVFEDDLDAWNTYVRPLLDSGDDVYMVYIDEDGTNHIIKITDYETIKVKLNPPAFSLGISRSEVSNSMALITIDINNQDGVGEWNIILKDADSKETLFTQKYEYSEPNHIIIDNEDNVYYAANYEVSIQALGKNSSYLDSDFATKTLTHDFLDCIPSIVIISSSDTSGSTTVKSSKSWVLEEIPEDAGSTISYTDTSVPGIQLLSDMVTQPTVKVTGSEVTLSEACYFNDIRYGKTWEWNTATGTITPPAGSSSKYLSSGIGWSPDEDDASSPMIYVAEIYRDYDSATAYGGTDVYALKNNTFIPIGKRQVIDNSPIYGSEGDTFFQRWDCLKTEPYAEGKENNIVEMMSLMVETHKNIDGRYDIRRGLMDNLNTNSTNINLINDVYSQPDNFITGQVLDDKSSLDKFPTQITWTKTKSLNEDIDTWTNITLASVLDMDGDKGKVTALRRFSNSIIAFQERGIAEILFNTRTQMSTTSGIPVELANSGKVDGKRYISDKIGCINKWSIVETSTGIFFIDNVNSSISIFNGGNVQSLSNAKGFKAWMQENNTTSLWNPVDFSNFIGFYDRANDDIYFVSAKEALCYNEMLSEFTSFYSYEATPIMTTVQDKFVAIRNNSLWEMHEGDYNNYFGTTQPFSITYKVTPDPYGDKTFTNIEYKADVFDADNNLMPELTFNTLEVWDEYQRGLVELDFKTPVLSNLKRKFRTWGAYIPRDKQGVDNPYGLNRIRNPWIYLKLEMNENLDNTRMEMHNLLVRYLD